MYSTLYNKISNTLDKVDSISKIYGYPTSELEGYPAVIYYPDEVENEFMSTKENMKTYRFKMWVVVSAEVKSMQDVFETILSGVVDDIIDQFDTDWDGGNIDDHRCWIIIDNGVWYTGETQDGKTAYAELNIKIKVGTNN